LFGMGERWQPANVRHGSDELPLNDTVVVFTR
jgi:hypothetical protein